MQSPSEFLTIDFSPLKDPAATTEGRSSESEPSSASGGRTVGYVIKSFPRLSETFILNEILAREANGETIKIASLRSPSDMRFHGALGSLAAPISWIPADIRSADRAWATLAAGHADLPGLGDALPDLLAVPVIDALQAIEVARWALLNQVSHLHAHFATAATTVARLASKLSAVPYSFTAHAKDIFHDSVDQSDLRRSIRDAHHVVTVSDYNVRYLQDRFGADADKVQRVYNGVDLGESTLKPSIAGRTAEPSRSYISTGGSGPIVSVGRLVPKKGFEHLIDAAMVLADRGVDAPILIGGTGRLEDDLRRRIANRAIGDRVRMLGALEHGAVKDLISSGSVFAGPFVTAEDGDREGLPTVVLEAMALGTPIVTTPVTGIPEAVIDGETGLLVDEGDPVALAEALAAVLSDSDLAHRLAFAARRRVERLFSLERQASELARLCWEPRPVGSLDDFVGSGRLSAQPREVRFSQSAPVVEAPVVAAPVAVTSAADAPVVAYVCTDPGIPVFGTKGASVHVRSILTEFVRKGWRVHLLASNYGGEVPVGLRSITCHELPAPSEMRSPLGSVAVAGFSSDTRAATREAKLIEIDSLVPSYLDGLGHLDLVYERYSLWSCSAIEYAKDCGVTSVLEINAPLVDEQKRHRELVDEATARERTARAVGSATLAYAVSREIADWATDQVNQHGPSDSAALPTSHGSSEATVHVIANGVDPRRFRPIARADSASGRDDHPSEIVVGFVGTFRPWHDVDSLVAAVAKADAHLGDLSLRLLLVGDGPGLSSARELAEAFGIEVEATGSVEADAVPGLLARMDVGLAPYPVGDGYFSPLKVFEYLAAGLPVVASRVGGLEELFVDGSEILLSDAGDYGRVVDQLMTLCGDPLLRQSIGAAGRRAVTERHSWSKILGEVLSRVLLVSSEERELVSAGPV